MPVHLTIKTASERQAEKAAADAVRLKATHLLTEWSDLRAKLQANWTAMQDAMAAARLFHIEISLPTDYPKSPPAMHLAVPHHGVQQSLFEPTGDSSIREMVLEELKKAGEKGIKAATIRRTIEHELGRELHYKTVGMTLYRLSRSNDAHRGDRFTWYFGPPPKTKTPAS